MIDARTLLLLLMLGGLAACSSQAPAPIVESEPELSDEEKEEARRQVRLERLKKSVKKVTDTIKEHPDSYEQVLDLIESIKPAMVGTSLLKQVDDLHQAQLAKYRAFTQASLEATFAKVDEQVGLGDFPRAQELLDRWVNDFVRRDTQVDLQSALTRFESTPSHQAFLDKQSTLARLSKAESDQRFVTRQARAFKSQGEMVKAIAILESFRKEYEQTPYYREVRTMITDYYEIYQRERAEANKVSAIPFVEIVIDEFLSEFTLAKDGDAKVFVVEDGEITIENTTESNAQMSYGKKLWQDYDLEFEVKYPDTNEEDWLLGLHGQDRGATFRFEYHTIDELPLAEWIKLRVEVKQGRVKIYELEDNSTIYESRLRSPAGGFAFLARPGEKLHLRNISYKLVSSMEGEAGESDEKAAEDDGE